MKILISPAKSLDFKTALPISRATQPMFLEQAETINARLEKKSKKAIRELMDISDSLAELNYRRYKDFSLPFTKQNARPAIYAFAGDVYQGFEAYTIPEAKIDFLQDTLRILSGLYGLLRPLDLIQPYRLEMGTQLVVNRKKNLYEFWRPLVTEALNNELEADEEVLNLASQEYFKAIDTAALKAKVISPVFKDFKDGELKIISFFAKKARGSMARYVIDKNIQTLAHIKGFNCEGYAFSEQYTQTESEPVFIR